MRSRIYQDEPVPTPSVPEPFLPGQTYPECLALLSPCSGFTAPQCGSASMSNYSDAALCLALCLVLRLVLCSSSTFHSFGWVSPKPLFVD